MVLLAVQDLVVRFRTREGTVFAVNGVSFDLDSGETLGLVGESGSGKSATNLAIMRLLPPNGRIESGRIELGQRDLVRMRDSEIRDIRGSEMAMIFQDPMTSLNPVITIGEQLVETIRAHASGTPGEARKRAVELLEMVGIPDANKRLRSYAHEFSGGMRQRVMIAMGLALHPRLLIADEPTTALDVTIQAQVLELLDQLVTETGTSVILVTHDLGVVARMSRRVAVMYAGFVVETATTRDLFASPAHPYTVGLLHSIPTPDADRSKRLIPIEGRPPDLRTEPSGCPFAARCAWRLDICTTVNPILAPVVPGTAVETTGAGASHLVACHNPPTRAEAMAGRPVP